MLWDRMYLWNSKAKVVVTSSANWLVCRCRDSVDWPFSKLFYLNSTGNWRLMKKGMSGKPLIYILCSVILWFDSSIYSGKTPHLRGKNLERKLLLGSLFWWLISKRLKQNLLFVVASREGSQTCNRCLTFCLFLSGKNHVFFHMQMHWL